MAEYIFKKMICDLYVDNKFIIDSKATSTEEIGNGVHYGTRKILDKYNIDYRKHRASQIKKSDYDCYDYIICMDERNVYNCNRVFNNDPDNKIRLLLEYANIYRDISDPWYTGNFEKTEQDVLVGLKGFLDYLKENNAI
jgi:protein-tyrosine phosphatase